MSRYYPSLTRGHPPSPPDTELAVEPSMPIVPPPQGDPRQQRADSDIASPYTRRAPPSSSIFYKQNETSLLARESPSSQRGGGRPVAPHQRWLVIVIPPPIISDADRTEDSPRRSNAVLLPLFPTMFAQLGSIAREFNLPSTTGLRLYLHLSEGSIGAGVMMPRITDEVWPLVWHQYLFADERLALPAAVPISGRIEFDLDLQTARWYNSWVRSRGQIPRGPQAGGDSPEESGSTARGSDISVSQSRPAHMRQLSLLERRPSAARSIPFPLETKHRAAASRRATGESTPTNLTTAAATGQVATGMHYPRDEVESLVQKWRANTPTINPGVMQMSPEPEPSPRSLDLDDFAWSISSAGPLTYDPLDSAGLSDYSPANRSMHLADRAAGSVVLTPSTATSFGPPRTGFSHEGSLVSNASRYPSPDLGARAIFEVPLTPSTATTWGPPDDEFDYALLLVDDSRYPSPDIAARVIENVPLTPSTATSWGPPDDDFDYANVFTELDLGERTPDLGERLYSPSLPSLWSTSMRSLSRSAELSTSYPNITIYPAVYPAFEIYPARKTLEDDPRYLNSTPRLERAYPNLDVYPPVYPFNLEEIYPTILKTARETRNISDAQSSPSIVYPFNWDYSHKFMPPRVESRRSAKVPFSHVYPFAWDYTYHPAGEQLHDPLSIRSLPATFEGVETSSLVYPFAWNYKHAPVEPARHPLEDEPSLTPLLCGSFNGVDTSSLVYPFGWDYVHHDIKRATPPPSEAIVTPKDLSSQVYPFKWDYSHKSSAPASSKSTPAADLSSQVYPFGWDYVHQPQRAHSLRSSPLLPLSTFPASFEGVEISSLVYPFAWNYEHAPLKAAKHPAEDDPSRTPVLRSTFDGADSASIVYPFGWDYVHHQMNKKTTTPSAASSKLPRSEKESSSVVYPFRWDFTLKRAQSTNLDNLPPTPRASLSATYDGVDVKSLVYPFRWNYEHTPREQIDSQSVKLGRLYPDLVVYSPVYPYNLEGIYPVVSRRGLNETNDAGPTPQHARLPTHTGSAIVRSFYPFNLENIYPPVDMVARPHNARLSHTRNIRSRTTFVNKSLEVGYPNVMIYRPVYPYNLDSLYPICQRAPPTGQNAHSPALAPSSYPFLCIYPSVYPTLNIYPGRAAEMPVALDQVLVKLPSYYPFLHIYNAVYPFNLNNLYPERLLPPSVEDENSSIFVPSSYPFLCIYPSVYPSLVIYPERAAEMVFDQVSIKLPTTYPFLQIYDHVYPFITVYPTRHDELSVATNESSRQDLPQSYPLSSYLPSSSQRSLDTTMFPIAVDEDEPYQDIVDEASAYREELLKSSISFYSDDFDLEVNGSPQHSRRSSGTAMGGVLSDGSDYDDDALEEMDSPTRRFYIARQRALKNSGEVSDDANDAEDSESVDAPFEFDNVPIPPLSFSTGRPSLSLSLPSEASGFFDDDEDGMDEREGEYDDDDDLDFDTSQMDDEMYAAYEASRPSRFPAPNLSAVTEEASPLNSLGGPNRAIGLFPPSPEIAVQNVSPARPTRPQRSPLTFGQ